MNRSCGSQPKVLNDSTTPTAVSPELLAALTVASAFAPFVLLIDTSPVAARLPPVMYASAVLTTVLVAIMPLIARDVPVP